MKQNVGSWDQDPIRWALGLAGVYVAMTALVGSCLGYRLMGRSTCPLERG
jgi:hypothetical protein